MSTPAPDAAHTLTAADGTAVSAMHQVGANPDLCFVLVHGFTGNWREERVQKVVSALLAFGSVVAIDMRGHGRSGGVTTLGDLEVLDVAVGVDWARELGYSRVATVGFSLGGAVVLREAGLAAAGDLPGGANGGQVDAVIAVSAPAFWYYKGTPVTRFVHRLVETGWGRLVLRAGGTRVTNQEWHEPYPLAPYEAAASIKAPLLVVHGDVDRYFPVEHPQWIERTARDAGVQTEVWVEPGFGHAENAITPDLLRRIGAWARECLVPEGG